MFRNRDQKHLGSLEGLAAQRGALTLFSAVLILFLMTIALIYASRISVFETRMSGNELRQKQAFHVAEAAIDQGMMLVLSNANRIFSSQIDAFPDGTGFTADGWFAAGSARWQACTDALRGSATHPCGGDFPAPPNSYYYDDPSTTGSTIDSLPVSQAGFPTGATARMSAVMCFVDIANPAGGCLTALPSTAEEEADSNLVIWLLGYGYSDCTDVTTVSTCLGRATIAEPISNWQTFSGPPTVPLVTKSTFPPTGTAELVGNPDGGGVGVPLTAWINASLTCGPSTSITSSGSWQTCEYEEWYHTSDYPVGVACTDNNCMCGPGGNDVDYFLSWKKNGQTAADCAGAWNGTDTCVSIDMIVDPAFPCDLFDTYFNTDRADYETIRSSATQILTSCAGLGPQSSGLIWIDGDCQIGSNIQIGSPNAPVILVTAGSITRLGGGVTIFGVLYVFDYVQSLSGGTNTLSTLGGATVYGAVINDGTLGQFQGNFQVVHAGGVLARAAGIAGIGSVNGGWRDFGLPDIAW